MNARSLRILWLSDSPLLGTGFGRVTREVTPRLARLPGLEVACLGWGYDGWPYERAPQAGRPCHSLPGTGRAVSSGRSTI